MNGSVKVVPLRAVCLEGFMEQLKYEFAHLGINCENEQSAGLLCSNLQAAFGFRVYELPGSCFATGSMEVLKEPYRGEHGHIGFYTNDIKSAVIDLEEKGFSVDPATAKYDDGHMISVYLKQDFGGFAVHLLQKRE